MNTSTQTELAVMAEAAKKCSEPKKPKKSKKVSKLAGFNVNELFAACNQITTERKDADSLLVRATLTEWTQPPSPKRDKKILTAINKWMKESDVTEDRMLVALKGE